MKLLKSIFKVLKVMVTALFNLVYDPENELEISEETEKTVNTVFLVYFAVVAVIVLLVLIFVPI